MPCPCGHHRTPQGCAGARTLAALPAEKKVRLPSGRPAASRRTGPLCACGCGRRCFPRSRYARQACVPREVRVGAMIAGWRRVAQQIRARRFKADIDRLLVTGRVSREDLIAFAHTIFDRGYNTCLQRERRRAA